MSKYLNAEALKIDLFFPVKPIHLRQASFTGENLFIDTSHLIREYYTFGQYV